MFAATYVKGGKVYDVRAKDLDKVFADGAYGFTEEREALKSEAEESIRSRGKVYAVFFRKKLVGLYILECLNGNLNLKKRLLTSMDDLVSDELDETVKTLVHCEIANLKYVKAFWNGEIIDKDYRKSNYLGVLLPVMCGAVNPFLVTFLMNRAGDIGVVFGILIELAFIVFILVYYVKVYCGGSKK